MHQDSPPTTSPRTLPNDWRERHFRLLWAMLLPVRLYLRRFPIQRGKGVLLRHLVIPLLPPGEDEFEVDVPGNARVALRYRETLGLSSLLYGTFELAELNFVERHLKRGDTVLDIGANVGIFSVVMAAAVGSEGRVLSFEPLPANVARLGTNLRRNGFDESGVFPVALGEADSRMRLRLADDPAYPSLHEVEGGFANGTEVSVEVRRLDAVWEALGKPTVSMAKLDVEGAELDVLRGAPELLAACRPVLLVEANSQAHLEALRAALASYGYRDWQPEGFAPHNHVFFCT